MGAGEIIGAVTQIRTAPLPFRGANFLVFSMWDYVMFNILNASDVECNNIDMTRVDRVDRSPPNHHQKHV